MGLSDPVIRAECDESGCGNFEEMGLTALARGAYDERHIVSQLERLRWTVDGDVLTCPEHVDDGDDDE